MNIQNAHNNQIKYFTLFGERNSGTTYLEKLLKNMLKLEFTNEYGFKHWYIKGVEPRGIGNTTTDNQCIKNIKENTYTLFVVIVRNVYDWVGAMYKTPHHIKEMDRTSQLNFVKNKYISYEYRCKPKHNRYSKTPWHINRNHKHPYFIEEASNIIELRNMKNKHFYNLQNYIKNYFLIRQEHLHEDLQRMIKNYNLQYNFLKLPSDYRPPLKYLLDQQTKDFINKNLNNKIDNEYYNIIK
jgi:hypothetical protein